MDLNELPENTEEPKSTEHVTPAISNCEPYVGMVFDTLEASHAFSNKYGRVMGFSTKIRSTKKSQAKNANDLIIARDYACCREGKKEEDDRTIGSKKYSETRCGCPCIMKLKLIKNKNKFTVSVFINEHNHPLEEKLTTQYLKSHRLVTDVHEKTIDVAEAAGLGPKSTYRLMSLEAGGPTNLGFIPEDIRSYRRTKRQKKLKLGEADSILEYFRKKKKVFPSFFHDYQYDCQGKLTNIFWADSRMIADYDAFGDVIMFDTTFGTNKASRPLGIFTGFNNHRQCVVFGACLLFDEKIPSFAWVFRIFLDCHGGRDPMIIFTDEDAAMKSALKIAMPNVRHCLCSWHILNNATKVMKSKLQGNFCSFLKDLKNCMYMICSIEKFEQIWSNLVKEYNIVEEKEKNWLLRLYDKKEQWSVAYRMNIFSAGVRSTQLVESANGSLKKKLGTGITMRKFLNGFDYFLSEARERERKSDFKSRQSSPHVSVPQSGILNHAAQVYTPRMFVHFNRQFNKMHRILLDNMNVVQGPHVRKAYDHEQVYEITYDPSSVTISCACCGFERRGYLCAHVLRVFDVCGINAIPDKYIMKRWTRNARSGLSIVEYPTTELSDAEKIAMLMSNFNRLVYRTKGKSDYVDRIMKFIAMEEELIDKNETPEENENDNSIEPIDCRVTGLKEKENNKGRNKKRALSCLEKEKRNCNTQKKKKNLMDQCSSLVINGQSHDEDDSSLLLKL